LCHLRCSFWAGFGPGELCPAGDICALPIAGAAEPGAMAVAGRPGCCRGALMPVTVQRTSHRGVSPGVPASSANAAVRLGTAVSGAGGGKAGLDEGGGRRDVPRVSKAGARAQPLQGAPWAGNLLPSGLGADVPWAASHGQCPRGCGDVPPSLQRSPTFPLVPLSSLSLSSSRPCAPASPAPAAPDTISPLPRHRLPAPT